MPDIATIWNAADQRGDWSIAANDLSGDAGLATAVTISLATDRHADSDDILPANSADPRGWWGDIPANGGPADPWGSKFWLRKRTLLTQNLANTLAGDAQQALQWLIDDGVAASVFVAASQQSPPLGTILLTIAINRTEGAVAASPVFTTIWSLSLA